MPSIALWLARALQWGGTASLGYFINDIATWFAGMFGISNQVLKKDKSGFQWWYILIIFVVLGLLLYLVFSFLLPKKRKR